MQERKKSFKNTELGQRVIQAGTVRKHTAKGPKE